MDIYCIKILQLWQITLENVRLIANEVAILWNSSRLSTFFRHTWLHSQVVLLCRQNYLLSCNQIFANHFPFYNSFKNRVAVLNKGRKLENFFSPRKWGLSTIALVCWRNIAVLLPLICTRFTCSSLLASRLPWRS